MVPHLQLNLRSPLQEFLGLEITLLPQLKAWLAPVFHGPETILLHRPRVWRAPARPVPGRGPLRAGQQSLARGRLSSNVQGLRVAPVLVAPVLRVDLGAPVDLVVPVDRVAAQEPVAVAVDPAGELREPLDAVARRVNPGSRSGRSGKNLKCGKLRV
jgi:hypothetical protein